MELQGKLISLQRDWKTGKYQLAFELDFCPDAVKRLADKLLICLKPYKEKRSRNANSFFHMICTKISLKKNALGEDTSPEKEKNRLLAKYGQPLLDKNGGLSYFKTNAPDEYMETRKDCHLLFLKTGDDGADWYGILRGTSDYTPKEMSILIKGAVEEAKKLGIDIPEDTAYIDHLIDSWRGDGE